MPTWDQTLIFHPSSLIPHPHRQDALGNDGRSYHTIIKENSLKCLHWKVADVSNLPESKEGRKFIMKEALSKLTWDGLLMGWMFMVERVRPALRSCHICLLSPYVQSISLASTQSVPFTWVSIVFIKRRVSFGPWPHHVCFDCYRYFPELFFIFYLHVLPFST